MRTTQSLLAERRLLVQESRDPDRGIREMAQFQIDQIDRELHERNEAATVATCPSWSVAQHARAK